MLYLNEMRGFSYFAYTIALGNMVGAMECVPCPVSVFLTFFCLQVCFL
jgi:hypothetical protein